MRAERSPSRSPSAIFASIANCVGSRAESASATPPLTSMPPATGRTWRDVDATDAKCRPRTSNGNCMRTTRSITDSTSSPPALPSSKKRGEKRSATAQGHGRPSASKAPASTGTVTCRSHRRP
jgi:hypothetical protein